VETIIDDVKAICEKWWERKIKAAKSKRKPAQEKEVRWSSHADVRRVLKEHPDGLTAKEIAALINRSAGHMSTTLNRMPDLYIDRWVRTSDKGRWAAVWCAVEVPPNCPRPETVWTIRRAKTLANKQRNEQDTK
jgi:hypothetical protein